MLTILTLVTLGLTAAILRPQPQPQPVPVRARR
jgi:hypothetical protein